MLQRLPDADPRAAALLRDTAAFFGRIVFARSKRLGLAEFEPREAVDEIVATVAEVIVPALDGQGALLWAPG